MSTFHSSEFVLLCVSLLSPVCLSIQPRLSTSWAPVHHLLLISSSRAQQEPRRLHSSPPDCCASAPLWCGLSRPLSVTHRHLSPFPASLWLSLCLPPIRFSHRLISPSSTLRDLRCGMAQGSVFPCQSPLICSPTPSLILFHSYHHKNISASTYIPVPFVFQARRCHVTSSASSPNQN